MTFIQLQNKIIQTRKARSGVHNRIDYFADDFDASSSRGKCLIFFRKANAFRKKIF